MASKLGMNIAGFLERIKPRSFGRSMVGGLLNTEKTINTGLISRTLYVMLPQKHHWRDNLHKQDIVHQFRLERTEQREFGLDSYASCNPLDLQDTSDRSKFSPS